MENLVEVSISRNSMEVKVVGVDSASFRSRTSLASLLAELAEAVALGII